MNGEGEIRRLVGYVRVSSVAGRDDNEEAFKSPGVQRDAMKRWATARYGKRHKWLEWFTDLDTSGSTHSRPLLDKASEMAIANNADLIVYNFSRYSRNLPEGLTALRKLLDRGVSVFAAGGGVSGGTAEDDLTLAMFLMMNQYQLAKIAEGWQHTIRRNKDEGRWHGVVPFGYRRATQQEMKKLGRSVGVIVPDEVNSKNVQKIFKLYSQGSGLYEIGKLGVKNGWFRRTGTSKDILRNPAYIGKLPVKKYVPAINRETQERRLDTHRRPLKEVVRDAPISFVDGLHKPIVTQSLWEKVQSRLDSEQMAPRTKYTEARFFAARRVKCGGCGKSLTFQPLKAGNYLTCPNQKCVNRPGAIRVEQLENVITDFIQDLPLVVAPALGKALKERNREAAEIQARAKQLDKDIAKLSDRRAAIAEMLAVGEYEHGMTTEDLSAALAKVRNDLEALTEERSEIEDTAEAVPKMEQLQQTIIGVGKLWDLAGPSHRLQILKSLSIEIRIAPSRKHADNLDGRVTVVTGLPTGDLLITPTIKK